MQSERLMGEVAVVTGSASGIGRQTAITLAEHGAVVVCLDINEAGLKETAQTIKGAGGKALAIAVNLTDSKQVAAAMKQAYETLGKLTILVNSAAIINYKPVVETSDEDWRRIMDVNIGGYFFCLREAYPYMVKSGGGRIVQFSSSTAFSGSGFANAAYATSKAAAVGLTKYIAGQWGKDNIRANTICPGLTETPIVVTGGGKVKDRASHEAAIPLGRIAQPKDMADVVLFLVSDESRYMTGTTLHVNGGKYMYGS